MSGIYGRCDDFKDWLGESIAGYGLIALPFCSLFVAIAFVDTIVLNKGQNNFALMAGLLFAFGGMWAYALINLFYAKD